MKRHAALVLTLLATACGESRTAPADPANAAAPPAATAAQPAPKPAPDPMKDAAAWKALPAQERAAKAAALVDAADPVSADAERLRSFLEERGETEAVAALARRALAQGSDARWAHLAAGDTDVASEVDACLRAAELAAEEGHPAYAALASEREKHGAAWWADAKAAAAVRERCAAVRKADEELASPYGQAISQWARWQRAIPVIQDAPAIHGARGNYLVFVSLNSAEGENAKRRTLAEVPPDEIARAQAILEKNLDVLETCYDAWIRELGPVFGFTRYTPENTDLATLFKMNVFTNAKEYQRYNEKSGGGMGGFARAYYSFEEPRFITTYDGGKHESDAYTAQVQCHEATHQLVHFYTWDLSRKALGREVKWLDCLVAPAWSHEGFAEFFSSFADKDGKRVFMQPLEERMEHLFLFREFLALKKWRPWEMKEFLSIRHAGQLIEAARTRVGQERQDADMAENVMGNLFYARAWSLVYFLWNAEDGGKPKYRDRYVAYLKSEFQMRYVHDKVKGHEVPKLVGINEFRAAMGLTRDEDLAAFEKEWQQYEDALVARHVKPQWQARLAAMKQSLGGKK